MSALDAYRKVESARLWTSMTPLEAAGQKAVDELEAALNRVVCDNQKIIQDWRKVEFDLVALQGEMNILKKQCVADRKELLATSAANKQAHIELDALRCCCKCVNEDHDAYNNWWCQFDPEPMNPNEFSTIEPHENCHFTPSRWDPKVELSYE